MQQLPTVGRAVHFLDPISGVPGATNPRAATITGVITGPTAGNRVSLFVMRGRNVDGKPLTECFDGVAEGTEAGCWQWPPISKPLPATEPRLGPKQETETELQERGLEMAERIRQASTPAPGEENLKDHASASRVREELGGEKTPANDGPEQLVAGASER